MPASTKTKPTIQAQLTALESEQRAEIEEKRRELAQLKASVPVWDDERVDALKRVRTIEKSWRNLSDEYSDLDHALATAAVIRTERRFEGAEAKLKYAPPTIRTTDTRVADLVALVLREYYGADFPTHVTFATVGSGVTSDEPLPFAIVSQETEGTGEVDGWAQGLATGEVCANVGVHFYRNPRIHAGLARQELVRVGERIGVKIEIVGGGSGDAERVRMKVTGPANGVLTKEKAEPSA